ncbi:XrtA system polysaccharide deacetylase [Paenibacillus cremeus]|uniref:XrtA system polysaccharide deacetylase n=1 Tax=Paenibacillus cremeus TaxID=2163881 RepID=UPI00164636D3|nr:XrtA system polysaccharide deacetylase [Paenibacillus cremeus]
MTVDVEDWYQTSDFKIDPSEWHTYEDRVVNNTMNLLELFDRYQVKGTFFTLGCVAEKHPGLIREIVKEGHEIASHGGWHRLVTGMTRDQFREDVRSSKRLLEDISGQQVVFFRAPSWSIAPECYDVLRILEEEGYLCDSSLQPFQTPLSGVTGAPHTPFYPVLGGKKLELLEFPSCVLKTSGITVPFSGGLYLRTLPYAMIRWALNKVNTTRPGMIYVHPWEIDTTQPRIKSSLFARLTHYHNLGSTMPKLEKLLQEFSFKPLSEIIEEKSYAGVALTTA